MASGGTGRISSVSTDPGVALRAGKLSSLKDRMGKTGRTATMALSLMQAVPSPAVENEALQHDRVAELQASRHQANKFTTPGRSTPNLQLVTESLRSNGDEEDMESANEIEQSFEDFANEEQNYAEQSAQNEDQSNQSKIKSQIKAKADDAMQAMIDKGRKEIKETIKKVTTEGTAKTASASDWGEGLGIVDTAGLAFSSTHLAVSVFQNGLNEQTKTILSALGMPVMKPDSIVDITTTVGTVMQAIKWSALVMIIFPFLVIFTLMAGYSTVCIWSSYDVCSGAPTLLVNIAKLLIL